MPNIYLTLKPGVSGDDGYARSTLFNSSSTTLLPGRSSSANQHAWIRFPGVSVPAASTVVAAELRLTRGGTTNGTPSVQIKAERALSPSVPTSFGDLTGRARTTASVTFNNAGWNATPNGSTYTHNVTTVVAEVAQDIGWSNTFQVFLDPTGSASSAWFVIRSLDWTPVVNPPVLWIHAKTQGGGQGEEAGVGRGVLRRSRRLGGSGRVVSAGSGALRVEKRFVGGGQVASSGWGFLSLVGQVGLFARSGGKASSSGRGVLSLKPVPFLMFTGAEYNDGYMNYADVIRSEQGTKWDTATLDVALDFTVDWGNIPVDVSEPKHLVAQWDYAMMTTWRVGVTDGGKIRVWYDGYFDSGVYVTFDAYTPGTGVERKFLRVTIDPSTGTIRLYDRAGSDIGSLSGWSEVIGSPKTVTPWVWSSDWMSQRVTPITVNGVGYGYSDTGSWAWDFHQMVIRDGIGGSVIGHPDARSTNGVDWASLGMLDEVGTAWALSPTAINAWSLEGEAVNVTPLAADVATNASPVTDKGRVVDGNYFFPYWSAVRVGTDVWVRLDVGEVKPLGFFRLGIGNEVYNPQIVDYSDDATNWTTAWTEVGGVDPSYNVTQPTGIPVFINANARYVRYRVPDSSFAPHIFELTVWSNIIGAAKTIRGAGVAASAGSGSLSVDKLLLGWGDVVSAGSARLVVDYSVAGAGLVVSEGWAYLHRVGEVDFLARRGGGNVSSGLGVLSVAEATTLRVVVQVTDVEFVAVLTAEMSGVVVPPGGVPPGRGGIVGRGVVGEDDEYRRRVHRLKHSTQRR